MFNPVKLALETEKIVTKGVLRKYYRFRGGRWYGGIATADCCGCVLRCVFCWSGFPRDYPDKVGSFYSPEQVFRRLELIARRRGYDQLRVSGNEPTIGRKHLLRLLELVDQTDYRFVLETSGVLIGQDYAEQLSRFHNVHVRVCLKGTGREEFSLLTGAVPEAFDLQLEALERLLKAGVSTHPAVMLSFSPKGSLESLLDRLREIDPRLASRVEEEYVILYPLVVKRLKAAGVKPIVAYTPSGERVCKF